MSKPIRIDDSTFQHTALDSPTPVLVDFTAAWCPPCKMLAPVLDQLSTEYAGQLLFTEVDTDEDQDLAARYGVQNMPTLVIFRGGREIHRLVGFTPKAQLKRQIDRALGLAGA